MFDTEVSSDIYGKLNKFRTLASAFAKKIVGQGNWPAIFCTSVPEQKSIMQIPNKSGKTLMDLYAATGYYANSDLKISFYKYLLKNYLCYVEYPIERYSRDRKESKPAYQKRMITANTEIIADWMGMTVEDAESKYELQLRAFDTPDIHEFALVPFLEIRETKDGTHKLTIPRKMLDLTTQNISVTPVFLLDSAVGALTGQLEKGLIEIAFQKDNAQKRIMKTTLDPVLLAKLYGGDTDHWVIQCKADMYKKDFFHNESFYRGYIKLADLGNSRYEKPTRSVNYNRIIYTKPVQDVDLSLINVDFEECIKEVNGALATRDRENVIELLKETGYENYLTATLEMNPIFWVDQCVKEHTTEFKRSIAEMVLANEDLFKKYKAGKPQTHADRIIEDIMSVDVEQF